MSLEGEFVPLEEASSEEEIEVSVSRRGEPGVSARGRRGVKSVELCAAVESNEDSAEVLVTCNVQCTWFAEEGEAIVEYCGMEIGVASMCCTGVGLVVVREESSEKVICWRVVAEGEYM